MKMSIKRLEAFSDGVMAIIITIMALNIPLPKEITTDSLLELGYAIAVFFVSFVVVGAQWEKHHWLFSQCNEVSGKVVWRNIVFLFFLSLLPLFTKWIMENPKEMIPAIAYDFIFMMVLITFKSIHDCLMKEDSIAQKALVQLRHAHHGRKFSWVIWFILTLSMIVISVLSFFCPTLSIVFFIGLPVASSLFNLWFTREEPIEHKKLCR